MPEWHAVQIRPVRRVKSDYITKLPVLHATVPICPHQILDLARASITQHVVYGSPATIWAKTTKFVLTSSSAYS